MFGYQTAFCWRNTAIYGGLLLFGVLYGLARDRRIQGFRWLHRPAKLWALFLFLVPLVADGLTHMLGLRDMSEDVPMDMWYGWLFGTGSQIFTASWWLRIITGLLAALGAVWFAFPRLNKAMEESEALRQYYRQVALYQRQRQETLEEPRG